MVTQLVFLVFWIGLSNGDVISRESRQKNFTEKPNEPRQIIRCMDERDNVPRYHVYKANAAHTYLQAKRSNKSSDLHQGFLRVEPESGPKDFYIDTTISDCVMNLKREQSYILYLKPTGKLFTYFDDVTNSDISYEVWVAIAEPTKYKTKKMREIEKYLDESTYCETCPKEPYIKKVHKFEPLMDIQLKDEIQLECKVRGFPQPYMYWHFNGRPIDDSTPSVIIKNSWKKSVLQIPYVTRHHQGNYTCHGTNFKDPVVKTQTLLQLSTQVVVDCVPEFDGYCLNGGKCFHLVQDDITACYCTESYAGERCQYYSRAFKAVGENSSYMVPLKHVVIVCFAIVCVALLLIVGGCIYMAHKNKRTRNLQKKLAQSLDYSNNFAPGQMKKGYYSALATAPSRQEIQLTNSFLKRPRHGRNALSNLNEPMDELFEGHVASHGKTMSLSPLNETAYSSNLSHSPSSEHAKQLSKVELKEQMILPLRSRTELPKSPSKSPRIYANADCEEERSRKSDETDCTATKEHRASKDTNTQKNSYVDSLQAMNENANQQKCERKPQYEQIKCRREQNQKLSAGVSMDALSDDDSPSPMSCSELSLNNIL